MATGGQFALASGGQFNPVSGGQFEWVFQDTGVEKFETAIKGADSKRLKYDILIDKKDSRSV